MKTAFVLSGGGAKGCFQVGVMKQLIKDQGILPDRIYGTSTGSLQASAYCHIGLDRLEQLWLGINSQSDIMSRNWLQYLSLGLFTMGEYNLNPLKKILETIAAEPGSPEIHCDTVITKVNLLDGQLKYCNYEDPDYLESVLASCSVPVINSPVNNCVDGGVRCQIPIEAAVNAGYDRIICIITNPVHHGIVDPWTMPTFLPIPKILIRVSDDILSAQIWLSQVKQIQAYINQGLNIQVYMPDQLLIDTQEYDPVKIRTVLAQGYACKPIDLTKIAL